MTIEALTKNCKYLMISFATQRGIKLEIDIPKEKGGDLRVLKSLSRHVKVIMMFRLAWSDYASTLDHQHLVDRWMRPETMTYLITIIVRLAPPPSSLFLLSLPTNSRHGSRSYLSLSFPFSRLAQSHFKLFLPFAFPLSGFSSLAPIILDCGILLARSRAGGAISKSHFYVFCR